MKRAHRRSHLLLWLILLPLVLAGLYVAHGARVEQPVVPVKDSLPR